MLKNIMKLIMSCLVFFLLLMPIQASEFYKVDVGYQGQVNNIWLDFVYGGAIAGSEGGETLDSLSIHLVDAPYAASIEYRVYTISGWSAWVSSFESASHNGEDILGLQVQLKDFPQANVYYQSYRQGLGWGIWVSNGKTSGTLKENSPITGFRVQVDEIGVSYLGINQSIRHNGETQGNGQSIDSVSMRLISAETHQSIEYRAYLRNTGWTDWTQNGVTLGTEDTIIEALEARLIGLPHYSVQIQPQVNGEWWGYVYDGQTAGTINNNQALTSYRVEIVQRVYVAPTVTTVVMEEEEVIVGGGSTINTSPLTLDIDNDGFDDPFGQASNAYWVNRQLISSYRVTGLTTVSFNGVGDSIAVIDTFNGTGDDAVNSQQFEVYLGTYVNGIFTITGGDFNSFSHSDTSSDSNYATHTMILYDNEDTTVEGYVDVYNEPWGDPEHLNGIVMVGVYEEQYDNLEGSWILDYTDPDQNYIIWVQSGLYD